MKLKNFLKENLITITVGIISLILIAVIATYTYSFFAVTATNSNIIAGSVENLSITVDVSKVAPSGNGKLIPQLDAYIMSAVTGRNGSCIDDNNNTVCHTYKITAKNNGTTVTSLDGTVTINKKNNTNLKWARYEPGTTPTLVGTVKETSNVELTTNDEFTAGQTKEYYIVVWISETGLGQTDNGNYAGTVEFKTAEGNGGGSTGDGPNVQGSAQETLAALNFSVSSGTPNFANTSCSSGCGEATVGIYAAEDDLGTSYYFRGDVQNNYVKFGKNESNQDMYWRIIRINGDGTVRMIYDGTQAHYNGVSSEDRQVGTSAFNTTRTENTYVGYMYGDTGQSTYALTHSNKYNSTMKTYLEGTSANNYTDGWYYKNIVATGYHDYVADAIYCNDRSLSSGTGIGTTNTYYGGYGRLNTNKTPTLKCDLDNNTIKRDSFTVGTNLGNGILKYPVGLITADEVSYGGGVYANSNTNESYYLYMGSSYWTMSPYNFYSGSANGFYVGSAGNLNDFYYVLFARGVRPVLSLKSNAIKYGDGTRCNPFSLEPGAGICGDDEDW